MTDKPGCPCSICDADFADTKRLQVNASVDLRDRIAAALESSFDRFGVDDYNLMADAVIRDVLTPEFLADLVIAAVQKAADND
jgi:hypothetical protein